MSNTQPLGLGLIGCGAFGEFCLGAYSEIDCVKLAAVSDLRSEAANAFGTKFSVPAYSDPRELISDDSVQIVHIATPPSSHYELLLAAAGAGKHILCEKPLAMNLQQADEMLAAVAASGTIAPVNFVLRYNAVTNTVRRIIKSGLLGSVLSGRLTNGASDSMLEPDHWFWDKKISGGIFVEHGVHFFDFYSSLLGPGHVIDAHTDVRSGTTQEDRVMCTVKHDSGAIVNHYHGFDQPAVMDRTTHHMLCELGDIHIDGWIPLELTIEAAVDDNGAAQLLEICDGAQVDIIEKFPPERGTLPSRGVPRNVTQRIRIHYIPQSDKQSVYANSARDLMVDQIAYIRDNTHRREIDESNGRDALALAEQACNLASGSQ
ncbi:MAG: Gfo/Idh/MocA family oxidoreductase [bacterium]|nr:Gfo/Idh/MocA family oxidoreductase [bacterium]